MKKALLVGVLLAFPFIVAAQTAGTVPATSGPTPSAAFIAQIKAQMASDPKLSQMPAKQLDQMAYQLATTIVRGKNPPAGSIATTSLAATAKGGQGIAQNGLASCFSYYHFGSVQANLNANTPSAAAGSAITFSGTLVNQNTYPLVDGTLYVKIFRYPSGQFDIQNGPDVVDQFIALDNITLPASSSTPATFSWKIPSYALSGKYAVAMYYTTEHKFNLLGLTFTDDVTGNLAYFNVSGEQKGAVEFAKDGVSVNGASYHFAQFPPHASSTGDIIVKASVSNTTGAAETVPVQWQLYSWDAQLPSNLITQSSDTVHVAAKGSVNLTYIIKDTSTSVYLLVGTVTWHDTKSVIGVRVGRDGIDRLRINFPGVTSFPLTGGQENTLFSCFYNSASSMVQDSRLDLRLLDPQGNEISTFSYTGGTGPNMLAVAKKFTPSRSYDTFMLEAKLYQHGTLVDQAMVRYDCKAIDRATCTPPQDWTLLIEVLGGLVLLAALALLWRMFAARARSTGTSRPQ
jgi:hypothetical protein